MAAWNYMNIHNSIHRPVLSLSYDRRSASAAPTRRTQATLSSRELKDIVAQMVG